MCGGISESVSSGFRVGLSCWWAYISVMMLGKVDSSWLITKDTTENMECKRVETAKLELSRHAFDDELKALRANASGVVTEEDLLNQAYTNLLAKIN